MKRPSHPDRDRVLVLMVGPGSPWCRQCAGRPREPPTDKKVVKLLADAEKARPPRAPPETEGGAGGGSRPPRSRSSSVFRLPPAADSPRASFAPALKYSDKLEETCPGHHIDVLPHGTDALSQGEYAEAAKAFQAFQRFPGRPLEAGQGRGQEERRCRGGMPELAFLHRVLPQRTALRSPGAPWCQHPVGRVPAHVLAGQQHPVLHPRGQASGQGRPGWPRTWRSSPRAGVHRWR